MNLPEISIKRHVFAYMLSAVLVLFGIISYKDIGVDRFPTVEFPMISITTILPGATPEIIDASVTNLIESVVNSTPGIDHIQSNSSAGVSSINVRFNMDKDVNVAFNEVQARVNRVLRDLPDEAEPPVVAKIEIGALPVMWLTLSGDRTLQQLNQYARNVVKKRLETIDGVGEIQLGGELRRTIRVNLDPVRMKQLGITVPDVVQMFNREHLRLPGGFLIKEGRETLIELDLEYHHPEVLGDMIVSYTGGAPKRLRDFAEIEDGLADYRQLARFNGKPAVGLGILKVQNANTVAIVDEIKRRLDEELIPNLPPGIELGVAHDDGELTQGVIDSLEEHLIAGTLLTALVVLLFLKNLRSTFIIAVAIPVSLLGAIAVMYFLGYTFNTMTMLGLLLLIGVVVDDAIVVLENIYRHGEEHGSGRVDAAIHGTRQVVFAVMAATLTLAAIFAPVIFMEGIIGRFFESFAVVVTFGVLTSLFVSLTLTPMLCSRFLKVEKKHGKLYHIIDRGFHAMDESYKALLNFALSNRRRVAWITLAVVLSSFYFFSNTGSGFMPEQDEGRFIISVKTPLGSSIYYTEDKIREIEKVLDSDGDIDTFFVTVGADRSRQVSQASFLVKMVPWEQRDISQVEMIEKLRRQLAGIAGVQAFPSPMPMVGGNRGEPLYFILKGPDLTEVARLAGIVKERLDARTELGTLDLELQLDLPQLETVMHRSLLRSLGLTTEEVALAINVLAGGLDIARFNDDPGDGERYDIRLKAGTGQLDYGDDISKIYLRSSDGEMVSLANLVDLEPKLGAAVISRYDLQYAANFYSTPTVSLGEAVDIVLSSTADLLPLGYEVKMSGRAEEFGKTLYYMIFAFVVAIILVYMVLASQFNSFIQPFIIMVAQPLAIIGGVFALWLTGHSLNIFSMIGLVLLMGLVAKNSILLVDLTNQRRADGKSIEQSLREACPIRLRPILMTSMTIILAMLPAAFGAGAGSDSNAPMAVAVIGGMISSTLLSLVVVPAVYSLVEGALERRAR
ncbi:MAG: efflux RND transporter permease subunit [Gammaproteobacteria bacterium]|nr:efflux RND transporter permease subunit [Gammaproteobacteria bacterium]